MSLALRILTIISLALFTAQAQAASQAQIDQARSRGIAWLLVHQRGDGSWQAAPGLEVQSTALALEALSNAGIGYGPAYGAAVAWLKGADARSVDSLSRKIIALWRVWGYAASDLERLVALKNNPYYAAWGPYGGYGMSFPDTPLALSAIRTTGYSYTDQIQDLANSVYCRILPSQGADGGWPYTEAVSGAPAGGSIGAILPTVQTIIELNQIKALYGWDSNSCGGATYAITTAVNKGISWLLTRKNADGGFGENGRSSAFETALAYQALTEVNSSNPAKGAALDYLIARQDYFGSWQGDPLQTAIVLNTFPQAALTDTDYDGIPDSVETLVGTNPSVADSRNLIPGNGFSLTGVTTSMLVATSAFMNSFSGNLGGGSGSGPFTWAIVSGNLPDGLSLNASTGAITGTPTTVGTFSFTYRVTNRGTGESTLYAGQITVDPPAVPALSPFGVGMAAGLLLVVAWTHRIKREAVSPKDNSVN